MYGKHLTKQQVDEMTKNVEGGAVLEQYLTSLRISVIKNAGHVVEATAPISTWERAFHTEFFEVEVAWAPGQILHRAKAFSLPENVAQHVSAVMNTVQIPPLMRHGPVLSSVHHS
jgi:subtilase family serine protease